MFDGGFDFAAWNAGPPSSDEEDATTKQEGLTPGNVQFTGTMPRPPCVRTGDWSCSCGNVNFARRTRCNKCGLKKSDDMPSTVRPLPSRGRATTPKAGKVPPLSSAGDWVCMNCMNHNWARRAVCNICQSARPTTVDQGPRLGRGKGHCDIQDPRERQAHDSDDELYDEYGRKKRKGLPSRKIAPQQLRKIAEHQKALEAVANGESNVKNDVEGLEVIEYLGSGLLYPPAPADAVIPWQLREQILEAEADRLDKHLPSEEEGEVSDSENERKVS